MANTINATDMEEPDILADLVDMRYKCRFLTISARPVLTLINIKARCVNLLPERHSVALVINQPAL